MEPTATSAEAKMTAALFLIICHSLWRTVLLGLVDPHRGEVVEVGSKQRLFTGKFAIAARLLHPTCEHPGCQLPAHLADIDHRIPASHGGPTTPANSAVECNPHNRLKHTRQRQTIRAHNRRLITIRTDGTLILPAGERPPPHTHAA